MIDLTRDSILSYLSYKLDELTEARFKRVVRGGKMVRKQVVRKGFKLVKRAGGKMKIQRMSPVEKRHRHMSMMKAWRKGKAGRVIKSARKTKRSMLKRKAIFGR
jgi:hypothetical protein